MEHRANAVQRDAQSGTLPFRDIGSQRPEERLDVAPTDIRTRWVLENRLECPLIPAVHRKCYHLTISLSTATTDPVSHPLRPELRTGATRQPSLKGEPTNDHPSDSLWRFETRCAF
jgi:hypothetical protein